MQKTDDSEVESIVLLIIFFSGDLIVDEWGVLGWGRKFYLGPTEIVSFSSRDFSQSNKHGTLLLWAISVNGFRPLKMYKRSELPFSTITFTVNSHADNHFYSYFCFKYYRVRDQFFY